MPLPIWPGFRGTSRRGRFSPRRSLVRLDGRSCDRAPLLVELVPLILAHGEAGQAAAIFDPGLFTMSAPATPGRDFDGLHGDIVPPEDVLLHVGLEEDANAILCHG